MLHSYLAFVASMIVSAPAAPAPAATARPAIITPAPATTAPITPAGPIAPVPATPAVSVTGGIVVVPDLGFRVAVAPTAKDVVTKVQEFYGGITQVTAKFRQTVTNATFGDTKTSDGKLWIKKPGKMRWDYYGKKRQGTIKIEKSFISDARMLWVVEHDNKQVVKKDLSKNMLPVAVTFLYGKGDLNADFVPELDSTGKYGAKTDLVLKLTPRQPSAQYKHLFLVVDPTNYRVKQSIIVDSSGNVNHFRFYEPDFARAVQDAWFVFSEKSVKNYKIVDGDQAAPAPAKP